MATGRTFGTVLLPPVQTYTRTGNYTITLTVSDGVDTSTITRAKYIQAQYQVYLPTGDTQLIIAIAPAVSQIVALKALPGATCNATVRKLQHSSPFYSV